ncbi:OmpA family protein [Oceanibaculum indicum]|uniref:Outer membrane protein OmpA-like peptidoglycan-associated protein n=1 Tax=Oceanibaculum indicum TaxID=526216 RepID=A0A420WGZ2_9PROT|nr:OmpA family protein [Oceanibaculum indicum]RKQ70268.1 outer membrane protein OmpA-like peptidoglycan-associated protein [Oceanibaculum indicum]
MDQRKHGLKPALMAATAVFALLLVTPATAQIVIGGDGNSSVTVNMDVLDGGPRGRLTTPGSDGRILLMPNAPREGQERIVLKPPASMRGTAQPAASASSAPALAAAPQLTPPASMRNTARPAAAPAAPTVTPPTAPAVRAPTALQPQKPEAPKVATPQIAAPKPAETPKPAAPAASTEKPQRTAALPSAKPEPVTPPAPKAEAKAAPQTATRPAEQRVAALPPQSSAPSQPAPAGITRLSFGFNQAEMDEAARTQLQAVAKRLQDNESLRVQLLAYAGGEGVSSSQARRLSLSRALAVRSQLIEQGIRSTRMDVRALGDTDKDGPADRVDIRIVDR